MTNLWPVTSGKGYRYSAVAPLASLAPAAVFNAGRVAASGAGVNVTPEAGAIRAGLDEVLGDASFGRAAGALADELARHPSTDEAFAG